MKENLDKVLPFENYAAIEKGKHKHQNEFTEVKM